MKCCPKCISFAHGDPICECHTPEKPATCKCAQPYTQHDANYCTENPAQENTTAGVSGNFGPIPWNGNRISAETKKPPIKEATSGPLKLDTDSIAEEWEESFDEIFAEDLADLQDGHWSELRTQKLKSFIRTLLKDEERHGFKIGRKLGVDEERARIKKAIEGMKGNGFKEYSQGFNAALDAVLKVIRGV